MEEGQSKTVTKFKINDVFDNLSIINDVLSVVESIKIYKELEIEPFKNFSVGFQAEYWYLKYQILRNGYLEIVKDDFEYIFCEQHLNIIWLSVTDDNGFILECRDGMWFLSIIEDHVLIPVFKKLKLSPI